MIKNDSLQDMIDERYVQLDYFMVQMVRLFPHKLNYMLKQDQNDPRDFVIWIMWKDNGIESSTQYVSARYNDRIKDIEHRLMFAIGKATK